MGDMHSSATSGGRTAVRIDRSSSKCNKNTQVRIQNREKRPSRGREGRGRRCVCKECCDPSKDKKSPAIAVGTRSEPARDEQVGRLRHASPLPTSDRGPGGLRSTSRVGVPFKKCGFKRVHFHERSRAIFFLLNR